MNESNTVGLSLAEIRRRRDSGELEPRREPIDPNPKLPDDFWRTAERIEPGTKVPISIRLDADVVEWFRAQGKGYQTQINEVLRHYVQHRSR